MNQQTANSVFIMEQEFELLNDNYQSDFEELCIRMAIGGIVWQVFFALLAILSVLIMFMMNAMGNWMGVGGFLVISTALFYGAFLPYRHAKAEIGIYYELIEDGEEVWALSDYPLSGFFHYMSSLAWIVFVLMTIVSWVSLVFLAIAFDNNHQATFLAFLLLFFASIVIVAFVIFDANAKKDYDLLE